MATTSGRTVLVGVDNTPAARAALRWAARHAARTGATVRAVYAFNLPHTAAARLEHDLVEARAAAQGRAHAWVADGLAGIATSVPVIVEVHDGDAATVLSRAARRADVLVVGDNRAPGRSRSTSRHAILDRCAVAGDCEVIVVDASGHVERPGQIGVGASA